jgi:hypothetical protein
MGLRLMAEQASILVWWVIRLKPPNKGICKSDRLKINALACSITEGVNQSHKELQGMTSNILSNDNNNNERIDRLEALMERLINVNLSTQEQMGFLAGVLKDTRLNTDKRFSHLETDVSEINRKIDIILRHITGMNDQSS